MEVKDAKYGVIFVHGIVGNNRIFDFLKPLIPKDFEVRYVTLAGHGGDALAFSRTSMSEWKSQVDAAISELSACCDNIIGVGHSMGCLLVMNHATGNRLDGLFLLNPPMNIRPRLSLLKNALKVAVGRTKSDPVAQAAKDAYGISLDFNPLHYYGWPLRYLELFAESRRVKKSVIPQINCPVVALLSSKDEMVGRSSAKVLNKVSSVTTVFLPDSTHYYYAETDKTRIRTVFNQFISQIR